MLDAVGRAGGKWLNDKRCEKELLRGTSSESYWTPFPNRKCWYLRELLAAHAGLRGYVLDHATCPSLLDDFVPLRDRRRLADELGKGEARGSSTTFARGRWKRRVAEGLKSIPLAGTLLGNAYALKKDALEGDGLNWLIRAMCVKVFMDQVEG